MSSKTPGVFMVAQPTDLFLRCIQGTGIQVPLQGHCLPDTFPGFLWSHCPVKSNYLIASLGQLFQGKMSILSKDDHGHWCQACLLQPSLHSLGHITNVGQCKLAEELGAKMSCVGLKELQCLSTSSHLSY